MKSDKLAEYINKWLEGNDRSYRWLARRAGISHTVVTDMTKGHVPKMDYLIAVERAMEVEPGELINLAAQIEERGGVAPRILSLLAISWKSFPPDLQRNFEDFFTTAESSEEVVKLFRNAFRERLSRGKPAAADDNDESDEGHAPPRKKSGRQQVCLSRREESA